MFTGNRNEKEIVMQLNLLGDAVSAQGETIEMYPESILFCSDGSVISGYGKEEISIVSWFPSFEMLEFYSGDKDGKIDTDCYLAVQPIIESLNMNYLIAGPM